MSKETNSKQHNAIMNAIKEALHDISDLEREIFYMSLEQHVENGAPVGKKYRIGLEELEQRFGRNITIPEFDEAVDKLSSRSVTVKTEDGEFSFRLMKSVQII